MQLEIYELQANGATVQIILEAICDSFCSLLWDVEYYQCGQFEIYIAANVQNLSIFQRGRIVGRDDDRQHYGIIETVSLETDAENGDYLTITGRFLMSLLSRRIIYPALSFSTMTTYRDIVQTAVLQNGMQSGNRLLPGLQLGAVSGSCWEQTARLQVSYDNLMDWIYKICEITGGTANIRLVETAGNSGFYTMQLELSDGTDRSILQENNPHMVFSDGYNNLLRFDYAVNAAVQTNAAYVFGAGEGADRKHTLYYNGTEPSQLHRYEVYVDAKDIAQETQNEAGETILIPDADYFGLLEERGTENLVPVSEACESTIATDSLQYQYNKDYFVGDYMTVEHTCFGLQQPKIQLVGMIESFDQNGRGLTPTFKV
ncbi:MAG: siphovirus ReqiPepy6 Gp37-like family protein [Oscillospiraceae bacterium]|nr:siphovirus ReqiPepy6 Gp37-like family protein [Oscillospiraceae bacterium]